MQLRSLLRSLHPSLGLFAALFSLRRSARTAGVGTALLWGGLGGLYLVTWSQQWTGQFGFSLPIVTAAGFAWALGMTLGLSLGRGTRNEGPGSRGQTASLILRPSPELTHLGLAAWTVASPWLYQAAMWTAGRLSIETLGSPGSLLLFSGCWATLILGVPAYWLTRLPMTLPMQDEGRGTRNEGRENLAPSSLLTSHHGSYYLGGLAVGILCDVFLLAPISGVQLGGLGAALVSGIIFLAGVARHVEQSGDEAEPGDEGELRTAGRGSPFDNRRPRISHLWIFSVFAGFGAVVALMSRTAEQLMPAASYLVLVKWAALLLGTAVGTRWLRRRETQEDRPPSIGNMPVLLVAVWAVVVPGSFNGLVDLSLTMNAHLSQVWLLMLLRAVLTAVLFLPVGMGLGSLLPMLGAGLQRRSHGVPWEGASPIWPVSMAAGYALICWAAFALAETGTLWITVSGLLGALAVVRWLGTRSVPRGWMTRGLVAASVCVVVLGPWLGWSYNPRRAAKLLFGSEVNVAHLQGVPAECLPCLDEGRAVATCEADRGTYTVWKYRSVQLQIRESGVPKGVVTTDPTLCPHYAAELMPIVAPLLLHEHPHRVLLLGLGSGVPLTAGLRFPVQQLTCWEGDAGLIKLMQTVVWPRLGVDPLAQEHIRVRNVDPVVGLATGPARTSSIDAHAEPSGDGEADDGRYDVIISNPDHPALLHAVPEFTVQFYRRAAQRLAADGLFCQRFRQMDFGPQPLRAVVRTMQAAFEQVAALQTGPGEMLLLGTNSSDGIATEGFVNGLQTPHVRRLLSRVGWDWSVPLNLLACRPERLSQFARQDDAGVNTAFNLRLAFRLPQEVMRWGPKQRELQTALGSFAGRWLDWYTPETIDPGLTRRLSEVSMQRELRLEHPDEFWVYRKSVRDHLTDKPRPMIQQVDLELSGRDMHPVDERRLDYFAALGQAVQQKAPSPESIRTVAEFADPYDPLITPFLHQEVARLYSRSQPRAVKAELRHRLHTVYYAEAGDRSIRNVTAALNLLIEHPEAIDDPVDRWDHINGLLQVLQRRWENRATVEPTSTRIVLNDIDLSVTALERAFKMMAGLRQKLGWPEGAWKSRQLWIERTLLRPLQTYRSRMLPHHRKQLDKKR